WLLILEGWSCPSCIISLTSDCVDCVSLHVVIGTDGIEGECGTEGVLTSLRTVKASLDFSILCRIDCHFCVNFSIFRLISISPRDPLANLVSKCSPSSIKLFVFT